MHMQYRGFQDYETFGSEDIYHHTRQEVSENSGIRDKAEGTFHEVKGNVQKMVGKITENP